MADMGIRQPRLQIGANVHRARLDNVRLPLFSFNRLDGDKLRDKQSNVVSIQCRLSTCGASDGCLVDVRDLHSRALESATGQ